MTIYVQSHVKLPAGHDAVMHVPQPVEISVLDVPATAIVAVRPSVKTTLVMHAYRQVLRLSVSIALVVS